MRDDDRDPGSTETPPSFRSLRAMREPTPAEKAFAEYLDLLDRGTAPDFDAWVAERPALAQELRFLHEQWGAVHSVVAALGLGAARVPEGSPALRGLLERLGGRRRKLEGEQRYRSPREVSRGGMGRVLEVWDADLERPLAMKVLLADGERSVSGPGSLGRFVEEARLTGQLDHPGIVPVHELGLDADGQLFFTMRLVGGEHLGQVLQKARRGEEGWSRTRVLGVLLRVCEAMAFAHEKGVVHRDLKPANVMVGRFGEVYVMDWGLARVLGAGEARAADAARPLGGESPLHTVEGQVVGTPCYMAPEQARGRHAELGPASDVYSVGAMLYELLTGRAPYLHAERSVPAEAVVARVLEGPPAAITSLASDVPPELVAICERAMAREPAGRYRDMGAMAEDLRAFLENRVVRAHRTGALVELRKWVERNRAVAASLAALFVVLVAASLWIAAAERRRSQSDRRLADLGLAQELVSSFEGRGPVAPEHLRERELWLERARELEGRRAAVAREQAALRERALPFEEGEVERARARSPLNEKILELRQFLADWKVFRQEKEAQRLSGPLGEIIRGTFAYWDAGHGEAREAELEALERELLRVEPPLRFASARDAVRHAGLVRFQEQARRILEPGGLRDRMTREVERIGLVAQGSPEWEQAQDAIARSPLYGMRLEPQQGLVPLRADPVSGLWEFWHVASGERPVESGPGGPWQVDGESGIVLVLIPGGPVRMGAQGKDAALPGFFPEELLTDQEGVVLEVTLDPFFLSKYELTQAQWLRLAGDNPSSYPIGALLPGSGFVTPDYPVDGMASLEPLRLWGLQAPTEPQWEFACRGGTDTPWWFGESFRVASFDVNWGAQNLAAIPQWESLLDGPPDPFPSIAPVDLLAPNPFGLYHVTGNLEEWCRGLYPETYEGVVFADGDGELQAFANVIPRYRPARGGSYVSDSVRLLSFRRNAYLPGERLVGIRPCRAIDR